MSCKRTTYCRASPCGKNSLQCVGERHSATFAREYFNVSTCQAKTSLKCCEFANTKQHLPSKIIVIVGVCDMGNKRIVRNRHISNGCIPKRKYQRISGEYTC